MRLHASIEKELSEFVLDRNDLEETLPPLRRRDDDYDEIERCIKKSRHSPRVLGDWLQQSCSLC